MKLFIFAVVVFAFAAGTAECFSIPFFGSSSSRNSTTGSSDNSTTNANSTSVIPAPCVPVETLSPTLQALQSRLPPQFAALVTPENVHALENVGTLAGLATSAATGNPIAIVKLVAFLLSKENPVGPLVEMTKEIVPLLKPQDFRESISNATHAVTDEFKEMQQNFMNLINRKPVTAVPTTLAPAG